MLRCALLTATVIAALSGTPSRAAACSCSAQLFYRGIPEAGARDVALNQALVVEGNYEPSSVRLEDADGNPVAVMATHDPQPTCPGTFSELVPTESLRANARYVIRAEPTQYAAEAGEKAASYEFSTGERILDEEPLTRPTGGISMVSDVPFKIGCGTGKFVTCIGGLEDYRDIEVVARDADGKVVMRFLPLTESGVFDFPMAPHCIEVQRRSLTGKRSEPLKVCGDDLGLRPYRDGDGDQYNIPQCRNGKIGEDGLTDAATADAGPPVARDAGRDEAATRVAGDEAAMRDAGGDASATGDASAAREESSARDIAAAQRAPAAASGASCATIPTRRGTNAPQLLWLLCPLWLHRWRQRLRNARAGAHVPEARP
jgi:hypothetical protein